MNKLLFYCLGVIAVYLLIVAEKKPREEQTHSGGTDRNVGGGSFSTDPTTKAPNTTQPPSLSDQAQAGLLVPTPSAPMHQDDGNYKG